MYPSRQRFSWWDEDLKFVSYGWFYYLLSIAPGLSDPFPSDDPIPTKKSKGCTMTQHLYGYRKSLKMVWLIQNEVFDT